MSRKIAVFSGGYDPLHPGHIDGFSEVESWADKIIVGVNSDDWLRRKKGYVFMPEDDRCYIINSLYFEGIEAWSFNDRDDTAWHLLEKVAQTHWNDVIYFCNGGDRDTCPEEERYQRDSSVDGVHIEFLYSVGGTEKVRSSSQLFEKAVEQMCSTPFKILKPMFHRLKMMRKFL